MTIGIFVIGLIAYLLLVTPLSHDRSQRDLSAQFEVKLKQAAAGAPLSDARRGDPVALLEIPKLGINEIVVEGARQGDLKAGPGHVRGTAIIGQQGISVLAGRRATFGSPFDGLNRLTTGDQMALTTYRGRFVYTVQSSSIVDDSPESVLAAAAPQDTSQSALALVTSDPWGVSVERVVTVAVLQGSPISGPTPNTAIAAEELDPSGEPGALAAVTLWGLLTVAALFATSRARHAWRSPAVILLAGPVIVTFVVLLYDSLLAVLPPTL